MTNSLTGAIVDNVAQYTELGNGVCYQDSNGHWVDSQDLIELTPTGAAGVRGPLKAYLSPNLNASGAITVTVSGQTFQSHPIGLYYRDLASGKVALIASVQDTIGVLVPPNQVVYSNAFSGLRASVVYVYAHNGFDQGVVLMEAPQPPDILAGFNPATSRLEIWTALDQWPAPQEQRPVVLKQGANAQLDLVDHLLFFGETWFPVGTAFVFDDSNAPAPGEAAQIQLVSPSDTNHVPVAKSIVQIGDQSVLVESVNYQDLLPKLKTLQQAALPADRSKANREVAQGRELPPTSSGKRLNRPLELVSAAAVPRGVVLDYTTCPSSANSYTFTNGSTYYIPTSFYLGPGTATFQPGCVVKYASNAWLLAYGPVSFPGSGYPAAVFTSKDDNAYGQSITNSTSVPNYAASQAIWLYYESSYTDVNNCLVRWAQRGVEEDENPGVYVGPVISSSAFQNCNIGVYVNVANDTLYLSGVTKCNVVTPISDASGYYSGSMTTDCGVVSVARVNDPSQDTASGDPNKNAQSECSFVVFNSTNIVAAFFETHLSEYALGYYNWFTGIVSPRSTGWSVSTNGGASFTDHGPIPPTSPADTTQGDAGDPVMAIDVTSNVIYLLTNPSRDGGWITNFTGFRLWASTNAGQSFLLINTNVGLVAGPTGVIAADKPMIAVDNYQNSSNWHHLYVAGHSTGRGVFVSHSSDGGYTWDAPQILQTNSHVADISIRPNGAVYVIYLAFAGNANGGYTNWIQYNWLPAAQSTWRGPTILNAHTNSLLLYSTNAYGGGLHLRSNSANAADYFLGNSFPRIAANPANGRIYVAYSDLPSAGSSTDQGDILIQEGIPNADDSITNWSGEIKVNNDRTSTDQWDPAVAVNTAGSEVFVGYYSRQADTSSNAWIKAYGAKANIGNGLVGATFDTFPISSVAFTNLFPGTLTSTPSSSPWLFDSVWVQEYVYFDTNARIITNSSPYQCLTDAYAHFTADDYTWATADSSFFYFAWRDCQDPCTNSWNGTSYIRRDPNIRLGKVKQ